MHTISALTVALKNAQSEEFRDYQQQVRSDSTRKYVRPLQLNRAHVCN